MGHSASMNYQAPPWSYIGTRVLNVVCRAERPAELHRWLPDMLAPLHDDGTFVVWFSNAPSIPELGPDYSSTECGIVIPVRTRDGKHRGSTFALIVVDNDLALAGGREIWGYPKKLGSVAFTEDGEGNIVAEARHKPYRDRAESVIVGARACMDGKGGDVTELVASLEPRYLHRVVPSPYGAERQSEELVRVSVSNARLRQEKKCGSAEVTFGATAEGLDRLGRITTLGAVFRVVDFVLPYGERLEANR
jgi:acetoacetate decarboxylase